MYTSFYTKILLNLYKRMIIIGCLNVIFIHLYFYKCVYLYKFSCCVYETPKIIFSVRIQFNFHGRENIASMGENNVI